MQFEMKYIILTTVSVLVERVPLLMKNKLQTKKSFITVEHLPSPVAQNLIKSCLKLDFGVGSNGLAVQRAMAGGGVSSSK